MTQQFGADVSSYLFGTPEKCCGVLSILQVLPVCYIQVTEYIALIPTYLLHLKSCNRGNKHISYTNRDFIVILI